MSDQLAQGALGTCGITYTVKIGYSLHLVKVFCLSQQVQPLRIELAAGGEEGLPVFFAQLSAKGVEVDDKSTSVGLKLNLHNIKSVKLNNLLNVINSTLSRQIHLFF
jgi:hypothetical protein